MQHLKEDLFEKVSAVLESPDKRPNGQAPLRAALAGRWQAALDKGARFWARHRDSSSAGQAELQAPLQDLHKDIHATIDAEVNSCKTPHKSTTLLSRGLRQGALCCILHWHPGYRTRPLLYRACRCALSLFHK